MTQEELKKIEEEKKVVEHIHLDGSIRPETAYEWLKEEGVDITLEEVEQALMVKKDCRDLNEYLEKFDLPLKLLQTEGHIERATYELFEDLAKQNVIYAEVRFAPSLHTEKGLDYNQIVEAAIRGMNKAKEQFDIEGNLILCCMRGEKSTIRSLQTVATAKKYLGKGVCGLDLAGAEALYPTKDYEYIFKLAKKHGIPLTIHAGEADGPESINVAIEYADRIGHGVRCLGNRKTVGKIVENGIVLEICPTSNLQTNAVENIYKTIEELDRLGVKYVINTDNNTVSNTNIIEEYKNVIENTSFTIEKLAKSNINAIRGAFITPQKKAELIAKLTERENKEIQK